MLKGGYDPISVLLHYADVLIMFKYTNTWEKILLKYKNAVKIYEIKMLLLLDNEELDFFFFWKLN